MTQDSSHSNGGGSYEPFPENGDGHGADGRWVLRNQGARKAGVYARQQPPELRAQVERFTAGILADLGGEAELSTLERAYVGRLAEVETTLRLLVHDIGRRGLLTPAGSVRRVYDQLLAGLDRWDRLAQRLGTTRRARRLNVAEQLAQLHQESR